MNLWRIFLFVLVVVALGLLVLAVVFNWTPWQVLKPASLGFQHSDFQTSFHRPPAVLAIPGALFTLYLTGVMVMYLFPRRVGRMARSITQSPALLLRLLLLGLLAGLLVSLAGVSSALTMGTFPLTVFLSMVLFLSILFGVIALAYQVGSLLLQKAGWPEQSPLVALLLGEVLLFALANLPGLGIIALFLMISLGFGVAIATRFGSGRPWSLISLTEEGKE